MPISNLPLKGTSDWFPQEFAVRKYIFDTWRTVCTRFGYKEYLTPLLEPAELYRAKSGEDVGGVELTTLTDRGNRELAIRPEMTPSVTRLVSRIYTESPKPLRLFSIANFYRNENPQRGRNREFWQLNFDIFGSTSINSDLEILQLSIEIMLAFNPPQKAFTLRLNSRKLIESMLKDIPKDKLTSVFRILDKLEKLPEQEILSRLNSLDLPENVSTGLLSFMSQKTTSDPEINSLLKSLADLGYSDYVEFNPTVLRGFDYYDGIVFEVFDNNPENKRAMFGGGRYNGLAGIFGINPFPAVGCAPGDETTRIFLESWKLVPQINPEIYYLPLLDSQNQGVTLNLAKTLRSRGLIVETGLDAQTLSKALDLANRKSYSHLIIYGTNEAKSKEVSFKNLQSGLQQNYPLSDFLS